MKPFAVPIVLLCLMICLLSRSHGQAEIPASSIFGGSDSTATVGAAVPRIVNEQQSEYTEMASILDLPYRLDLVDCPKAVPVDQSIATYKSFVYYSFWWRTRKYRCCVWQKPGRYETIPLQLNERYKAVVQQKYEPGLVQHISFSCPSGGRGEVVDFTIDLPSPVDLGIHRVCIDSVSFIHDRGSHTNCQFCGSDLSPSGRNSESSCWARLFSEHLMITFRSSYRTVRGRNRANFMGFNLTIECIPSNLANVQQEDRYSCLMKDPQLTSKQYFENLNQGANGDDEQYLRELLETGKSSSIPFDAKETLRKYYDQSVFSSEVTDDPKILHLALLCERSCDDKLAAFATKVVHLLNS